MTDRIEHLRRKEQRAVFIGNVGVMTIWLGLFGLLAAAFGYPNDPAVALISGTMAGLGVLAEVIAGHFADTYRWEREDIELGKRLNQ